MMVDVVVVVGVSHSLPFPSPADPDAARIRVKRYRQSLNNFQGQRGFGCRFGTCGAEVGASDLPVHGQGQGGSPPGTRSALRATAVDADVHCPRPAWIGLYYSLQSQRREGPRTPGCIKYLPPSLGFRRLGSSEQSRTPLAGASRAGGLPRADPLTQPMGPG